MNLIGKMKIGTKIMLGFLIMAVVTTFLGFSAFTSMNKIMTDQREIADVRLPSVQTLLIIYEAQTSILGAERGLINPIMFTGETRIAQYTSIESSLESAEDAWQIYAPLPQTKEETVLWNKFIPQ